MDNVYGGGGDGASLLVYPASNSKLFFDLSEMAVFSSMLWMNGQHYVSREVLPYVRVKA